MAKISQYPDSGAPQSTDQTVIARAGQNFSLLWSSIAAVFAPIAKGVTNGDTHDHSGGDGGTIAYASLSGKPNPSDATPQPTGAAAPGTSADYSRADHIHAGGDKYPLEARLTLETGVAVSTSDQADKTMLYLTPYKGCQVATYSGSAWSVIELTGDLSLDISGYTASKPYDIFVYNNSGTLTLEGLVWTDGTTRATALALQNGVLVKSGATTRRYLGTIYMDAASKCQDTLAQRFLWNYYNRVLKRTYVADNSSHAYTTTSWRYWNNDSTLVTKFVVGVVEDAVMSTIVGSEYGGAGAVGLGVNSSTGTNPTVTNANASAVKGGIPFFLTPNLGYQYHACCELGAAGFNSNYVMIVDGIKG